MRKKKISIMEKMDVLKKKKKIWKEKRSNQQR